MRRNCNLELCLFPLHNSSAAHNNNNSMVAENGDDDQISPMQNYYFQQQQQQQQQPLTIFYDGKISVTDVTELQAKSILMMANKKVEERVRRGGGGSGGSEPCTPTTVLAQSPHQQLYSPGTGTGLSMKKSLQSFLQKRKNRVQEASPYHH